MKDMNKAKLTADDLPLFNGITSDLFPGIEIPSVDYDELIEYITREAFKLNLQVYIYMYLSICLCMCIYVCLFTRKFYID